MEIKTLEYMNSKAWFRSLKVIYFLSLISTILLILLFPILISAERPTKKFDLEKSYVLCNDGRKLNPILENIIIDDNGENVADRDKNKAGLICNDYDSRSKVEQIPYTDKFIAPPNSFKFVPAYKIEPSWSKFIFTYTIVILVILIIFEIIKRLFYYIVIGKFKPD